MDAFSLVNIILITIIYSTFVAPALRKLNSIRDEIAEIIFPTDTENSSYNQSLEESGEVLEKKMTLYELKYSSLKTILNYFNIITLIVMLWLFMLSYLEYIENKDLLVFGWLAVVSGALFFLWKSVRANMIKPNEIRSIHWLTNNANINYQYFRQLTNAGILVSITVKDANKNTSDASLSMVMKRSFYGQKFILIITDESGKIYHVSSGTAGKQNAGSIRHYANGEIRRSVVLGKVELYKGDYKAKLYIFEGAFNALDGWNPIISSINFKISDNKQEDRVYSEINMNQLAKHVEYTGSSRKIKSILCKDMKEDDNLSLIVEDKGFISIFTKKDNNFFKISNINGLVDRHQLRNATRKSVYLRGRIKKSFKRKLKKITNRLKK